LIFFTRIYAQQVKLADDLVYYPIAENIYLAIHSFPWPANSLVITGEDEILFIDTPYNDEASEKLIQHFNNGKNRKMIVINTHFHNDNLGGNNSFIEKGAVVYGSDVTVNMLETRGLGIGMLDMLKKNGLSKYYDYFKDVKLTPPNRIFDLQKGLLLDCCNDTVEVFFPGAGHSPDNVVVYLRKSRVLFAGCIVKSLNSKSLGNLGDAELTAWPESIEGIITKFPDAVIIIPGHGETGDTRLLQHTLELLKGNEEY